LTLNPPWCILLAMEIKGQVIINFNILDLDNISSSILFGEDLEPHQIEKISKHLSSQKRIKQQSEVISDMMRQYGTK